MWDDLLSEQDRQVIQAAGYDQRGATVFDSRSRGVRPAVLVIDMQRLIVHEDVPILDAIRTRPIAIGAVAHRVIERIAPFLQICRDCDLLIVYTRVIPHDFAYDDDLLAVVDALQPADGDVVIDKHYPSAFYGTTLITQLVRWGIDTTIVVGNSTSGCVRATAVDARQHGFHVIVPEDLVFDRIEASHKIGLLDLWMKYAAVVPAAEVIEYIQRVKDTRHP